MRAILTILASLFFCEASLAGGAQLIWAPPGYTPCYADTTRGTAGYQTGNIEFNLENLTDGLLPNPATIVGSQIWVQGGVPPTVFGNLAFAIDPQQSYGNEANFPAEQNTVVSSVKTLGIMQLRTTQQGTFTAKINGVDTKFETSGGPYSVAVSGSVTSNNSTSTVTLQASGFQASGATGEQFAFQKTQVPYDYVPGDAIIFAPECAQIPGLSPNVTLPVMLGVVLTSDVTTLPFVLNFPAKKMLPTSNPGRSIRNLLPATTAASTKLRVKVYHAVGDTKPSRITNMAVCVQAAPGSPDCAAPPVPMKCWQMSGAILYPAQSIWCDWTAFTLSPGQVPIVIADVFTNSDDGVAHWSYNGTTGLGDWIGTAQSYNTTVMGGSPTWQPNRTHVMYGAQVQ